MKRILSALICCAVVGCSGGGGGGESTATGRPKTGFRVLHANIDVSPVDAIEVGAALVSARFAEASSYKTLPAGTHPIDLAISNVATTVVASDAISLAEGEVKSLLLYGDKAMIGVRTTVIENPLLEISGSEALVRVVHGVVGAAAVTATAGEATVSSETAFGSASDYVAVSPGATAIRAERAADGAVIYAATETLHGGRAYTILLSGDLSYYTTGRLIVDQG